MLAAPLIGAGLGLGGGLLQYQQQRKAQKRLSQLQDQQLSAIGQARQALTGPLSAGQQGLLNRQLEQVRAGQAQRGIFESGVAAGQEAELSPILEHQLRQQQYNALLGIGQGIGGVAGSQAQFGAGMGQGLSGAGQLVGTSLGMFPGMNQFGFGGQQQMNPFGVSGFGAGLGRVG